VIPDLTGIREVLPRATGTGWAAAYRQDVAALLAAVEALQAERDRLRAALAALCAADGTEPYAASEAMWVEAHETLVATASKP
jgi:hypothetical protein